MTIHPPQKSFDERRKLIIGDKYLTYDIEGTGLSKQFDVPFQFAAALHSKDGEVFSTYEYHGRLPVFVLPSPKALLVTGKRISEIQNAQLSHYEFMGKVHQLFDDVSPATITSYNGISYDEEILRFSFFGTLRKPYVTQFGSNRRLDILKALKATPAAYPSAFSLPINERGKQSLKLEDVAAANGFENHRAHDALGDVEATMHVAQHLKSNAPRIWAACSAWQDRDRMIALLDERKPIVHLGWSHQKDKPTTEVLIPLTFDEDNPNECICVSVDADIEGLRTLSPQDLKSKFRWAKGGTPLRRIKANAMPTIAPLRSALAQMCGLPSEIGDFSDVIADGGFQARLREANALRKAEFLEPAQARAALYSGSFFPVDEDAALVRSFHAAPPEEKFEISQRFTDQRARENAFNLIGSEWRWALPAHERLRFDDQLYSHLTAEDAPWTTVQGALAEIEQLSFDCSVEGLQILEEYEGHLRGYWDLIAI